MKFFLALFIIFNPSQASDHLVFPELVSKNESLYLLSADKCREAFQLPTYFNLENIALEQRQRMKMQRGKVLISPYLFGSINFRDETSYQSENIDGEVNKLKLSGALYKDCTSPLVKKFNFLETQRFLYARDESFIRYSKVNNHITLEFELSGIIKEDVRALRTLLDQRQIPIFYNSLEEIGSCEINADYDYMVKFKDVVVHDRVCRYKKECKKFLFFTTCKERYRCEDIPREQRYLEDALLEDSTVLNLNISRFGNAQTKRRLLKACIDGFITSHFYSNAITSANSAMDIALTPAVRHFKDSYHYYDNEIEAVVNNFGANFSHTKKQRQDLEHSLVDKRSKCFKQLSTQWLPLNHNCLKKE